MVYHTYYWGKLLKYFKRTFKVKNTYGEVINNVSGSKDNFILILFSDDILEKKKKALEVVKKWLLLYYATSFYYEVWT